MPQKSFRPSRWQLLPPIFSGSTLKIIAIITMLIDHIGAVILEYGYIQAYQLNLPQALSYENTFLIWKVDWVLRKTGRIAFPIFCFLLVEGFIRYMEEDNRPQVTLDVDYENGMGVTVGRLREDSVYDYKFIGLSHNTVRGAAGGAVLCAETLKAKGFITKK